MRALGSGGEITGPAPSLEARASRVAAICGRPANGVGAFVRSHAVSDCVLALPAAKPLVCESDALFLGSPNGTGRNLRCRYQLPATTRDLFGMSAPGVLRLAAPSPFFVRVPLDRRPSRFSRRPRIRIRACP
jgi:hypothetical protein